MGRQEGMKRRGQKPWYLAERSWALDVSGASQEQGRARNGKSRDKGYERRGPPGSPAQGSLVPEREPRFQMAPSKVPVDPWEEGSRH